MKNVSRRAKRAVALAPAVYTVGVCMTVLLVPLLLFGRVRVRNWHRLFARGPVILAPNHPSMLEPFVIAALYAPVCLLCPWLLPWSTPDVRNFMDKWWFILARPACIGVFRDGAQGSNGRSAARQIISVLVEGRDTVSIHPEGGRTSSKGPWVESARGKRIREIRKNGITLAVSKVKDLRIIPIWFEGTDLVMPRGSKFPWRWWHHVTIVIGEPFSVPPDTPTEEILRLVEQKMLACGDQVK